MQDLHVGRDIDISGTAAGSVILLVPAIDRHPDGEVRPARKEGYAHARKNIYGIVVLKTDITIRRQFQAQMVIRQSVRHVDDRQGIGPEESRSDARRLAQIGF